MHIKARLGALAALALVTQCAAAADLPPKPTVSDIVKESKPADWRAPRGGATILDLVDVEHLRASGNG